MLIATSQEYLEGEAAGCVASVEGAAELLCFLANSVFEAKNIQSRGGDVVVSKAGQGGVSIVDADLRFGARPSLRGGRFALPRVASVGKVKVREHHLPCTPYVCYPSCSLVDARV